MKSKLDSQYGFLRSLALSLLLLTGTVGHASESNSNASIGLRAMLFYAGSGTLSPDILVSGGPELGNVVAGDNPSTSTLVIADISLAPDQVLSSDSRVEIVAQKSTNSYTHGRVLLEKSVALGAVARGGKTHIGFWLEDTGCAPVELRATLRGNERLPLASTTATISFTCNE